MYKKKVVKSISLGYQRKNSLLCYIKKKWQLYVMLLIPLVFLIVFKYVPMYGAIISFKDYRVVDGIMGSPWTDNYGLKNFIRFFKNYNFVPVLRNTIVLSVYSLLVSMPAAVIFAISLNYTRNIMFKKSIQMISYAPYFISTVVFVAIINMVFDTRNGVLGSFIYEILGINVLAEESFFSSLYVWSGVWQSTGYGAVIYLAALAGVDPQQHEAAIIDGATVWQRIRYVDLPSILPTITIMLILNMGNIMGLGYEKVYAMQNQFNINASEIISTYSYKVGLVGNIPDFSYASAIGLFQSVVGLILIVVANKIANKVNGYGFM